MKTLTDTQLAYLAGFIDGDGSIIAQLNPKNDYTLKFQIRVSVNFIQSTSRKHFLKRIHEELGIGTLRDRNDSITELNIVGIEQVKPLLQGLKPFLRMKEKQANLVLRICDQLPSTKGDAYKFLELSKLSDQVANLNDSKKRTITSETVRAKLLDLKLISEETQSL